MVLFDLHWNSSPRTNVKTQNAPLTSGVPCGPGAIARKISAQDGRLLGEMSSMQVSRRSNVVGTPGRIGGVRDMRAELQDRRVQSKWNVRLSDEESGAKFPLRVWAGRPRSLTL